jgi:hypothetical protein
LAIKALDRYMDNIPQSHLLAGDAVRANKTLKTARANYAAGKTSEKVAQKLKEAELQAGSAHSGSNIDNARRQKLRPLLTSKKQGRGLTQEEQELIEASVMGSPVGNALRAGGKALGGGGGLGAFVTGGLGGAAFGLPGYALPALGYGVKKAGDIVSRRQAQKIEDAILRRSPLFASGVAGRVPQYLSPRDAALLSGLYAAQLPGSGILGRFPQQ